MSSLFFERFLNCTQNQSLANNGPGHATASLFCPRSGGDLDICFGTINSSDIKDGREIVV